MRTIMDLDESRPGICTEAGLAQAQFNLSELLAIRAKTLTVQAEDLNADDPRPSDAAISAILDESASLARTARRVLVKPHPLGPLNKSAGGYQGQQQPADNPSLTTTPDGIPKEHELALFDHLQPVFDGRFTGLHLLQYLRDHDFNW